MGHEGHHHEEKQPLSFFASPLIESHPHGHHAVHQEEKHGSLSDTDIEQQQPKHHHDPSQPNFENMDCSLHDNPAFHRHAEATTAELFYDLFFVANLTTFTSLKEINDHKSLTSYIGFFSLLWLTWYQVSLYDVRFSSDSVFERIAKSIHFGVMVGFAVMGVQWQPGVEEDDFKIYKAFGFILMASRLTLFAQYGITLFYTKKFSKTIVPLAAVMAFTLVSAIIYGATTAAFPNIPIDPETGRAIPQTSNVYIAWYVVGVSETILTVAVSCIWRIVSFKGTHMVQRMSLLSLIILGEGIIVICKSISKIVKNEYFWSAPVVGQIIAAVLIIYFLYMLYFDRMQEEHFGSIKQQIWSFLHFPLHVSLVLILQGVSLLVIWRQAVDAMTWIFDDWNPAFVWMNDPTAVDNSSIFATDYLHQVPDKYENKGAALASYLVSVSDGHVYNFILGKGSKTFDSSTEQYTIYNATLMITEGWEYAVADPSNETAVYQINNGVNDIISATLKTMFDTFSVNIPKSKDKKKASTSDYTVTMAKYVNVFDLIMTYTFVAGGLALILTTILGYISLPKNEKRLSTYIRLGINGALGLALCLIACIRFSADNLGSFLVSSWMIPTICLTLFVCVVVNHIRLPKRKRH